MIPPSDRSREPILRTKVRIPFTRAELVPRPRLQEKIARGLCRPLTLITAPAGFGKTTLAASYAAWGEESLAWLSLDKNDNQAGRFLRYFIAALQEIEPAIGSEAMRRLESSQQTFPETVLASLINDLESAGREIILVLDDYQFISSQAVHEAVAFLLEHCPKVFHLVIATRSDPPLPINRLRARGQAVELRAADLRFSEPEAARFLNEVMGLSLDARSVSLLEERTEGWIAGLQMAALSMRDREDVPGFIQGFSGTNRYILDYLLEEVLNGQPPEMQRFLLCTSVLERLTAPLCEAVLQVGKMEGLKVDRLLATSQLSNPLTCQPVLEYLERANLFLVPLDQERQWYRYHHLFADLLHARLDRTFPGLAPLLHARAAGWYEENGFILDAIQHASLASDDEMVERIIEQHYLEMMNRGEMAEIRLWMGKLSKELVCRRPWLCLYEAFRSSWFGQLEEANYLLNKAEESISAATTPDTRAMRGYHAYVLSRVTAMQGDTRRAIELCLKARELVPDSNLSLQIEMGITLGYEYFLYGDFANADQTLNEMIRSCAAVAAVNNPVAAYAILARMRELRGQLHEAHDLLRKAALLIHETGGHSLGVSALVEVETASILFEWNDLQASLLAVKQGLEFLPLWGKADDSCLAYTLLGRIQLALGNPTEAAAAIEKASQLVQTAGVFSEARSVVEASQVRMWLVQGDWLALDRWLATLEKRLGSPDLYCYEDELAHITQARIFIAQQRSEKAVQLLSSLEDPARSSGRQGRLIEILVLKAIAQLSAGNHNQAEISLTESLALAEPGGYVRVFLDEGQPVQKVLSQYRAHTGAGPLREYATRLLTSFETGFLGVLGEQEKVSPASDIPANLGQTLVEPLSPREREVLQLIALGNTNQEIARELFVSRGTVKAHTASIYRKLDVANRTGAVARARQLGLLP